MLNSVVPTCANEPFVDLATGGLAVASMAKTSTSGSLTLMNGSCGRPYASNQWYGTPGMSLYLTIKPVIGCGNIIETPGPMGNGPSTPGPGIVVAGVLVPSALTVP